MKLVQISLFKPGFGGGSGQVAHEMARRFSKGHEVALICPGDETRLQRDDSGLRIMSIKSDGEGHVCIPRLSQKNVNVLFDFLDEFVPQIVHVHEPISLSLMGQVWAKMHGVPFVYTAHVLPSRTLDFGASDMLKLLSNPWTETLTRQMLLDFHRNCDAVIALNGPAATDLAQYGYRGRVFTIPNARDLDTFGECSFADATSTTKTLLFVGFVNRRKNQHYLVQVLERLPSNYRLNIVGHVMDAEYGRQIERRIEDKGLKNVVLTGPVTYDAIPRYLERAHIYVSASRMEVQSLAVIEALASGTPVVGLSNETVDELVDSRVGCRLPADTSPEQFARCVTAICNLPRTKYERMCVDARSRVAHLGWPRIQEMTLEAYHVLLSEHTANGEEPDVQIDRIIALIPSTEIRETLTKRVSKLGQVFQETLRPHSRPQMLLITRGAKRVSLKTWIYVGLTRLACAVISLLWRLTKPLRTGRLSTEGTN